MNIFKTRSEVETFLHKLMSHSAQHRDGPETRQACNLIAEQIIREYATDNQETRESLTYLCREWLESETLDRQ